MERERNDLARLCWRCAGGDPYEALLLALKALREGWAKPYRGIPLYRPKVKAS